MLNILEKLSAKKAENAGARQAEWVGVVSGVADENGVEPGALLVALDRLDKSIEELQAAAELLAKRRAWAATAAAGDAAEESYAGLLLQERASEKALEILIQKHRSKCEPLGRQIDAARLAISSGADARRRLLETAGDEARQAAFDEIDAQLGEVQVERNLLQQKLRGRRDWVFRVESLGKHAATADVANLADARAGLRAMIEQDADLAGQTTALQDRRNTAAKRLLEPEAI
jgi:hypothetical protein